MSFLALNVPFQKTAGLCNQLYNIVQTTIFGIKNTTKIIFALSFIPILCIFYYIKEYLFPGNLIVSILYGLIFIGSPLLYFSVNIWAAKEPKDFHHLSAILKWVLFFGILSILVINLNMKHNA